MTQILTVISLMILSEGSLSDCFLSDGYPSFCTEMLCSGEAGSADLKTSDVDRRHYKSVTIKLFLCTVFGKWVVSSNVHIKNDFNSVLRK